MKRYVLGIDQGTTGVTAILFNEQWQACARGYREIRQIYPQSGYVEHDAEDIWRAVCEAVQEALTLCGASPCDILCVGIDHEGESVMLWDKKTGKPLANTIVWQDKRTAKEAEALAQSHGEWIFKRTGLQVDSYFSALKLKWLYEHCPEAPPLLAEERLLAGTMDSWIAWKMTGARLHITDLSTASRTMLLNLQSEDWDEEIAALLGIPLSALPQITNGAAVFGETEPAAFCGIRAPLCAILNDQQAALFGHGCFEEGAVKTTYGTGAFMLMNTGASPVFCKNGLITTVGWRVNGQTTYALDGGVYTAGAAMQWLRDGLKLLPTAADSERLATTVADNGGVYFVPAFSGLAAPYNDPHASGTMIGLSPATTREHIVRAALEATAYQVCDLVTLAQREATHSITSMRCDGGMSNNGFLMQFQADLLGIPLFVPAITDTTALGTAFMAAIGAGLHQAPNELTPFLKNGRYYEPKASEDKRQELLFSWHRAVERSRQWNKE